MSNKKLKAEIPATSSGVRADVNQMMTTPEMAQIGENCIFYDGTIRPRPALTKVVTDPVGERQLVQQYQEIYSGENTEHRCTSFIETSNGFMLMAYVLGTGYVGNKWALSVDGGQNWTMDVALSKPGGTNTPGWMMQTGDYIIAFCDGSLYRSPVSGLPSTLTWTTMATGLSDVGNGYYSKFQYDYSRDLLWMVETPGYGLWVVYDVSGAGPWSKENLIPSSTPLAVGAATNVISDGGICGDWYVQPIARDTSAPAGSYVQQWLTAYRLNWDGSSFDIDLDNPSTMLILSSSVNPLALSPLSSARSGSAIFDGSQVGAISKCIMLTSASGVDYIQKIDIDQDGFVVDSLVSEPVDTWGGAILSYVQTGSSMTCIASPGRGPYIAYRFPNFLSSSDGGETWMRFDADIDYIEEKDASESWPDGEPMVYCKTIDWRLFVNDFGLRYFMAGHCEYDDWATAKDAEHPKIYIAPTTQGGGSIGDVTTMFQANLSDEDNVVIIGTTKGLARLDRTTNTWRRITASHSEQVDTGGDKIWNDGTGVTADVPPLSSYPSDASYESGVSIDGTYGVNPWVFRTFEAQGETFLIGTNGQCYPIIYHPDMPKGMARRLGEMTVDDPNYNALASSPLGDLAPRARCIATAANRVMLGNDPTGSPYGVSVGGFNDPDREWGQNDYQYVLLGDTPGGLVSMNEISALQVALYKEDAIYHALAQTEFLGVSAPFRFELSKAGISGPCSPNVVMRNFDGRHIYLARDGGVYMYDGVAPIDGGRNIRRLIQSDINNSFLGKTWGMVDHIRKLVWIFYPSRSGLVNRGIVISTDQGYPWPTWPVTLPENWNFTSGLEVRLEDDATVGQLGRLDSYGDQSLLSFMSGSTEMLMSLQSSVCFSQKWEESQTGYDDDGIPIGVHLRTGWLTPAGVQVVTADTLHHIFSSSNPEERLNVVLRAQQLGQNIRESAVSQLWAGKTQRRTQHRVSGVQFSVDISGQISSIFNWGGAVMSFAARGGR